ncbi:hypothetical protein DZC75_00920 [Pseudomonas parafulva]|uniref:Uncharacterized protein n=1 Tax=Pseudomonas parafulva TaxID=157782 RepID=A0AAI8P8E1_9PSED|nr:hypothetical protein DZC75_00920 [Pseudomonas parafulva]
MFQAIENAGQYTQPPRPAKARRAGAKTRLAQDRAVRWSRGPTNIRRLWPISPKMRVFIIFEQP